MLTTICEPDPRHIEIVAFPRGSVRQGPRESQIWRQLFRDPIAVVAAPMPVHSVGPLGRASEQPRILRQRNPTGTARCRRKQKTHPEQAELLRLIEQHQTANQSYMAEGIRLLELARNARHLFKRQEAREKRRLLNFLVSNCSWRDKRLTAKCGQPFYLLADMAAATAGGINESDLAKSEFGWEAGIRTPITRSRAACPTIERPPSMRSQPMP